MSTINTTASLAQYSAKAYQDRSQNRPQASHPLDLPQSAKDLLARKLEGDFQHGTHQATESPISVSSGTSMPEQLDFTVGSKDSLDNDQYGPLAKDVELDISLEHETRSVGSASDIPHQGYQLRYNRSNPDLSQDQRQTARPIAAPSQDLSKLRSRSVENLSPRKTNHKQWNMVDIDIDTASGARAGATAKPPRELPPPINSSRLRPIRQKTRNAVVNILEDGWVCLEFFKSKNNEDKVLEVLKISPDGLTVSIIAHKIILLLLISI